MADKSNTLKSGGPPEPIPSEDLRGERVLESRDLLAGRHLVVIRHEGRHYQLRLTRLGKLILTA